MEATITSDIDEPPYLKAIQCLNGQKPGEKYRHLNAFIQSIVKICRETGASPTDVIRGRRQEIPADALLPLVRVLTGIELKLTEAVIEALKSPDIVVVNKALRAKWFFNGSNSHVDATYFKENIFPFVSIRTRMDIVKALSRGLIDTKAKAENFFNLFYDMYGLDQAMPFLPCCSEKFIFDIILKFKIVLSMKMLDKIFQRYPDLAIRYLYLGCSNFSSNEADRKIHTINLPTYGNFLPKLIKKHVHNYIELFPYVSDTRGKIGSTRRRALLKNAEDFVMKNMQTIYSDWPLKYIYYRLSKTEFEKFYVSLHPAYAKQYQFMPMFNYLSCYPKDSRIEFMIKQYEQRYKTDFFTYLNPEIISSIIDLFNNDQINEKQFEMLYTGLFPKSYRFFIMDNLIFNLKNYSNEKMLRLLHKSMKKRNFTNFLDTDDRFIKRYESEKYLLLLPNEEKSEKAQHLIAFCEKGSDKYYKWCCFLPVEQSFNIFKFGAESSSAQKRVGFLKKMIYSCKIYNDQTHLTKVLKYYIQRHKNERSSVLHSILEYLSNEFNLLALHDPNWQLFSEIVETAYIKNELFNASVELIDKIFEASMHRLSIQSEQQMQEGESSSLIDIIRKYLEFKIIYRDDTDWTIFETIPDLENKFIKLLIFYIPIEYPENHEIWREDDKKVKVVLKIISKLHKRNKKIIKDLKLQERTGYDLSSKITRVKNYTWLMEISEHLLQNPNSENSVYFKSFKTLVENFDKEFYLSVVQDDPRTNILLGKAIWYLKKNCTLILNRWEDYFSTARKMMQSNKQNGAQAAKNFIISTKWHQELPLRFIKSCVAEINKPGSLTILALLVDGESLSKFLSNYIPSEPTVDIHKINAKEEYRIISFMPAAINLSVPFVSTEILMPMFQDEYIKLGQQSLRNFGQRVDKPNVINFAKKLMNRPVSVKKHGIRLILSVLTVDEIIVFLTELFNSKQHPIINMISARCIFHLFITYSNDKTWNLLNNFFDQLTCNDFLALKILTDTKLIRNQYATLYFKKLLSKIEDLNEQSKQTKTEKEIKVICYKKEQSNVKEISFKENLLKAVFENVSKESVRFLTKETIIDILRTYYFRAESKMIAQSLIQFANTIFSSPFIGGKEVNTNA